MATYLSPALTGPDIPVQLRKYAAEYKIIYIRGCWAAISRAGAVLMADTPGGLAGAIAAHRKASRPRIPHQRAS